MKISIGITTYNRSDYLEKMARSLSAVEGIADCNIRIYDDCSKEYDIGYLKKVFPTARQIVRREKNLGSDLNIANMYIDFLKTGDDILLNADSDLIFNPNLIKIIKEYLPLTDGVLGLYNSHLHPGGEEVTIKGCAFLEKSNIGSAGVVFRRDILAKIVENFRPSFSYDWKWSAYLLKIGVRLLVLKQSIIQHFGLHGYNQDNFPFDFGLNFEPGNEINREIVNEFIQNMLIGCDAAFKAKIAAVKNSMTYKIGLIFTWPILKVFQTMKIRMNKRPASAKISD